MNTLEKNLLNAVKFINLKKLSNAGFIVEKNQAVFYSGKIIFKFRVENIQHTTRHFLVDMLKLGEIYESINDKNTQPILNAINNYFNVSFENQLNLPKTEFFDFLDAIFRSNNELTKYNNQTSVKIESDILKIENKFKQDSSENFKELSFEYEINNQQNFDFKIYTTFKFFLKFIKSKKQDFNFFGKKHGQDSLFLAKNNNFEILTIC
jgi:hypothetical protein